MNKEWEPGAEQKAEQPAFNPAVVGGTKLNVPLVKGVPSLPVAQMHMVRTALATTGKGCFASAFSILFTFSGELYPTVIRQTGLGFLSMIARAGAILAPLIHMIANYVSFLPPVIFSASAIMAGLTAYTLLETRNSTLLDTVEEVEIRWVPAL
ncbi:hypothetical protein NDU88_003076 [Pleurodeles waltl]|uniref:Uncharacterized protein n=1 Tax=Pleurodeles waltl TaxID=8319 RepID=A0AAV7MQL6_PLEWA|nr:hypothetical protein NDU88_003076 [Pleurodeles waltl]